MFKKTADLGDEGTPYADEDVEDGLYQIKVMLMKIMIIHITIYPKTIEVE